MITIQIPDSGPLYEALWRFRRGGETVAQAASRAVTERVMEGRIMPRPRLKGSILSTLEVLP